MDIKLYPSVMCMDSSRLLEEIRSLEEVGVDGFHVDVMDGDFVTARSPENHVAHVRAYTSLPLEVHLMVRKPADYLEEVYASQPEVIYVHAEAEDISACLKDIRKRGYRAGLAVAPGTPFNGVAPFLPSVDQLLVLRVTPGCCGQPAIPHVESKIAQSLCFPQRSYGITCDGAVTADFIAKWHVEGVEHFVCGMASGFFHQGKSRGSICRSLKQKPIINFSESSPA